MYPLQSSSISLLASDESDSRIPNSGADLNYFIGIEQYSTVLCVGQIPQSGYYYCWDDSDERMELSRSSTFMTGKESLHGRWQYHSYASTTLAPDSDYYALPIQLNWRPGDLHITTKWVTMSALTTVTKTVVVTVRNIGSIATNTLQVSARTARPALSIRSENSESSSSTATATAQTLGSAPLAFGPPKVAGVVIGAVLGTLACVGAVWEGN